MKKKVHLGDNGAEFGRTLFTVLGVNFAILLVVSLTGTDAAITVFIMSLVLGFANFILALVQWARGQKVYAGVFFLCSVLVPVVGFAACNIMASSTGPMFAG